MSVTSYVSGFQTIGDIVANTDTSTNTNYLFISCVIRENNVDVPYIFQVNLYNATENAFSTGNGEIIGIYGNYLYYTYMNDNQPKLGRLLFDYYTMTNDNSIDIRFNSIYHDDGDNSYSEFIDKPVDVVSVSGYLFYIHSTGYISRFTVASINTQGDVTVNDGTFGSTTNGYSSTTANETNSAGYSDLGGALHNSSPTSLATDGTYVYIGCSSKILKMGLDGTSYGEIASNLSSAVSALSVSGNYLYALLANDTVLKIDLTDFTSSTFISSGLTTPNSMANNGDYLYISDSGTVLRSSTNTTVSTDATADIYIDNTQITITDDSFYQEVLERTTSVSVKVVPTDSNVTSVTINGDSVTSSDNYTKSITVTDGSNNVVVVVTAQDGTTQKTYSGYVYVPDTVLSSDTTLKTFTVNGDSVEDDTTKTVDIGTTSVSIKAEPNNQYFQSVTINGTPVTSSDSYTTNINVSDGTNTINVIVTAENGNTQTHTISVYVSLSSDTSLSSFIVDGNNVENGFYVTSSSGTTSVSVIAYPTNTKVQSVTINGTTVTANDGYSTYVSVYDYSNTITIGVTAQDGTYVEYSGTVYVTPYDNGGGGGGGNLSNDAGLGMFQVNYTGVSNNNVSNGAYITITSGITSVSVVAYPSNNNVQYVKINDIQVYSSDSYTKNVDVSTGSNTITISVKAEDGTDATYSVTVIVPSSDTSLSTFTVDDTHNVNSAISVDTIGIYSGTTSVKVIAYPNDVNVSSITIASSQSEATTVTDYSAGLYVDVVNGSNTITVVVTAEDGTTTQTYTVNAYVYSNVVTLSAFTINGYSMGTSGGGSINLPYGTTEATVSVTTTSSVAYITITADNYSPGNQSQTTNTSTVTGLTTGENTVTVRIDAEDEAASATYTATIYVQNESTTSITCFEENTKILCFNNETSRDEYVKIKDLRKGHLVKTVSSGYKAINMIGKRDIYHPSVEERIKNQLYKCSTEKYAELFEDLIITGCHCILVKKFASNEEKEKTIEVNGNTYVTDKHYRLPACADERASVYEESGNYTIYHIALDNEDYYMNYGVYANGLLVETSSQRYLKELSGMELIE